MAEFGPRWRNSKHAAQWPSSLTAYVYPTLGDLPVSEIDRALVLQVLTPIWSTIPETASRVRGRIQSVLNYGFAHGWRDGENPARWDILKYALAPRPKAQHHAALPYADAADFISDLRAGTSVSALALEWLTLTATRASETTCAE